MCAVIRSNKVRNAVSNWRNKAVCTSEAFRAIIGEILASCKNLVKIRGNACLNLFPVFAAPLRLA
jgi:hypothetical protein